MSQAYTTQTEVMPLGDPADRPTEVEGPSLLMHAAGWLAVACGLYAANITVEEPTFLALTLAAATVGCVASYMSRLTHVSASTNQAIFLVALLTVCAIAIAGGPVFAAMLPVTAADRGSKAIAVFLAWVMVACCFTLVTDTWLLFLCVFVVGLMGLAGTVASSAPLTEAFMVFLLAASFMMVHQGWLGRRWHVATGRAAAGRLGSQALLTLACLGTALAAGVVIAVPLRAVGAMVALTAGVMPVRPTQLAPLTGRTKFDESQDRAVGTGPVQLSDQIVMMVRTNHPAYLRGSTLEVYTGRGWRAGAGPMEELAPSDGDPGTGGGNWLYRGYRNTANAFRLEPATPGVTGSGRRVEQTIRFQSGVFSDLYVAAEPTKVTVPVFRLMRDANETLRLPQPVQDLTYQVVSKVVEPDAEVLADAGDAYPAAVRLRYLDAGPITARTREAALQVTASLPNEYAKAEALARWVASRCRYNTNAEAIPAGEDVADYFLFTSQEGYCDTFATALTVLCRAAGIPARIATGFLPGDLDEYRREYLVLERDKHMWTEVFFPGAGWVVFDATSGAVDISGTATESRKRRSSLMGFLFGRGILPPLAVAALLGMVGYVVRVEILGRRRLRRGTLAGWDLPETNRHVVLAYERACSLMGRRGLPRAPDQTPDEHLRTVRSALAAHPETAAALQTLTEACVLSRYSGREARQEDVDAAHSALARLRNGLRRVPRRPAAGVPSRGRP